MNFILILLLPIAGLIIGWATNKLAIWMLFHPKKPINLGLFRLQGVLPKRREYMAAKVSEVVASKLIGASAIEELLANPKLPADISSHLLEFARSYADENLGLIGSFVASKTTSGKLRQKVQTQVENFVTSCAPKIVERFDMQKLIEAKIKAYSLDDLEVIVKDVASREFKTIEVLGGVLGMGIGFLQAIITLVIG